MTRSSLREAALAAADAIEALALPTPSDEPSHVAWARRWRELVQAAAAIRAAAKEGER